MGKYDAAPTLAAGIVRLAREKAGLTQRELAERAGVSQQVVSAYETGRKEPTLPTLQRLAAAAGLEIRIHLVAGDDHDQSLQDLLDMLPSDTRAELESIRRERLEAARLRRRRGR